MTASELKAAKDLNAAFLLGLTVAHHLHGDSSEPSSFMIDAYIVLCDIANGDLTLVPTVDQVPSKDWAELANGFKNWRQVERHFAKQITDLLENRQMEFVIDEPD